MENIKKFTVAKACALTRETKCTQLEEKLSEYQLTYFVHIMSKPSLETLQEVLENDDITSEALRLIKSVYKSSHPLPKQLQLPLTECPHLTQFDSNFFFANTKALNRCESGDKVRWIDYPLNRAALSLKFAKIAEEHIDKGSVNCDTSLLALTISGGDKTGVMLQYNKTEDTWEEWNKIKIDLNTFEVIFNDNELIFIGGTRKDHLVGEVYSWSFKNKRMKKLAALIEPRHSHSVVVLNNNIYAIGGKVGDDLISNLVEMYCAVTKKWKPVKSMIVPRHKAGAVAFNGKIYVIGGMSEESEYQSIECYNSATNSWTMCKPMHRAHGNPGVAVHDGYIYVVGGFDGQPIPTVEVYNPDLDVWTVITSLKIGRSGPACFTFDNQLWAVGGCFYRCGCETVDFVEVYDELNDQWIQKKQKPINERYYCFTVSKSLLE